MRVRTSLVAVGLAMIGRAVAALTPGGVKCGETRCSADEYCSPYDSQCKLCANICNVAGDNPPSRECVSDCQEYLHDKRYVLLQQYEDLRGEVGRLWVLATVSSAVAFLSLLTALCLLANGSPRWKKLRDACRRIFAGKWIKRTTNQRSAVGGGGGGGGDHGNNNNNKSNKNRSRTQDDAELGTSKPNGLKLTMPSISATVAVAPSRSGSATASGNGSGSEVGNGTPNTTSTSLSRRHPSEDTTLDYAYDNPAMTPSPEAVQLRTKRESSF